MAELKYLNDTGLSTFKELFEEQLPTKISGLDNDAGYLTSADNTVSTQANQGLTETEQSNARTNINAQIAGDYVSSTDFSEWQEEIETLKDLVYSL